MEAIMFKSKIQNGFIQIPEKYKQRIGDTVKVIVITEQTAKQTDIIDKLLANPIKSENFWHPSFGCLHFRHSGHARRLFGGHDPESTRLCNRVDSRVRGNDVNRVRQVLYWQKV